MRVSDFAILRVTVGLVALAVLVLILGTRLFVDRDNVLEQRGHTVELNLQVPYPILLLHGLGGDARVWLDAGLVDYLEQQGLRYGGTLHTRLNRSVRLEVGRFPPQRADFFTVEISDPFQSLEIWQREIRGAVEHVLSESGAPRVVLVGFSAGGVAARKYLVTHPNDHRVAKLVTLASPHQGSELANVTLLGDEIRKDVDAGWLPAEVLKKYEAVIARASESTGIRIDSPLVRELVPPDSGGGFLTDLNRSEHPRDLEYVCLVTTGSSLPSDRTALQAELAEILRGDFGDSGLGQKLLTLVMQIAAGGGNRSQTGDGAVLSGSQHLGRVAFFREHPELVRDIEAVPSGHMGAKARYEAILRAIAGPVEFLRLTVGPQSDGEVGLKLDIGNYLAGLARIEARDDSGSPVAVGRPRIRRMEERGFARVAIGPLPQPLPAAVDVLVTVPSRPQTQGKRLLLDTGAPASPKPAIYPQDGEITFWVRKVWGFSTKTWDLVGPDPELQLVLFSNGGEVARSSVMQEANDPLGLDWHVNLRLDPRSSQLRLELWDIDLNMLPETMGQIVWQPGKLPLGRTRVLTETGISVDLEVSATDGEGVLWDPDFLRPE